MSGPHPTPGPGPHPQPAVRRKPRPSAWWWLGPGLLVLAAIGVVVASVATAVDSFSLPRHQVPADGAPHVVPVTAGETQMLWMSSAWTAPTCRVVDTAAGADLPLTTPTGSYEYNSFEGMLTFTASGSQVEVTCVGEEAGAGTHPTVRVGPAPDVAGLVGGILVGLFVPMALGGLALVWAVGLLVVTMTRPSRSQPATGPYAAP